MRNERFSKLQAAVGRIVQALEDDQDVIDVDLSADALAFVMAIQLDLDPRIALPSQMRKAADEHCAAVQRYARYLRKYHEKTGQHFGETLGGEITLVDDFPSRNTKH